MVDVLLIVALAVMSLVGALLTVFQLPGLWLTLAAAIAYAWYYDWQRVQLWMVAVLAAIALVAEIAEFFSSAWFTKKGGGSRRAAWCGLLGGIAGAIMLTIPVPIIGTIIGAAIGCFLGALVAEMSLDRGARHSARLGLLAAVGQTLGTLFKMFAAVVMAVLAVVFAIQAY